MLGYLSVLESVAKANTTRYLSVSNQSGSIPIEPRGRGPGGGSHSAQTTGLKNIPPKAKSGSSSKTMNRSRVANTTNVHYRLLAMINIKVIVRKICKKLGE